MSRDLTPLKDIKEKIVGMWYDPVTEAEYFFHYPVEQEGYAEMLLLQDSALSPVPFKYRVIEENEQLLLELDGKKYSIVEIVETPIPTLSFIGPNDNMIVLYKEGSIKKKKRYFFSFK